MMGRLAAGCLAAMLVALQAAAAEPARPSITLAAVFDTAGPQALFGRPARAAADLAVRQINQAGGILGAPLKLVHIDGNSRVEQVGAKVARALDADLGVTALFGLADSDLARAAGAEAALHERVFLTSGATSPKLPHEVPGTLFLAAFGDNVQAAAAADWAYARGLRSVRVLYEPDRTYPLLLKDYFMDRFSELGGHIEAAIALGPEGSPRVVPPIGDPDMVFLSVETAEDAVPIIEVLRELGYHGPVLGGDGYDAASVWAAHPSIRNVFYTTHVYLGADNADPLVAAFVAAFREATDGGEPTAFAALAYDSVGLLAAAMEKAGTADPARVAGALAATDGYRGVTGSISYADGTHVPYKPVSIVAVTDGGLRRVATTTPRDVPAP